MGQGTALPIKRRFLAVTLGEDEGGPYHPPLWQRQRKEGSSCTDSAPPQCKASIDSAGLLRFLIGKMGVAAQGKGLDIQLCGVVRAEPALSFTFVALAQLSKGGPYHPPLRRCHG